MPYNIIGFVEEEACEGDGLATCFDTASATIANNGDGPITPAHYDDNGTTKQYDALSFSLDNPGCADITGGTCCVDVAQDGKSCTGLDMLISKTDLENDPDTTGKNTCTIEIAAKPYDAGCDTGPWTELADYQLQTVTAFTNIVVPHSTGEKEATLTTPIAVISSHLMEGCGGPVDIDPPTGGYWEDEAIPNQRIDEARYIRFPFDSYVGFSCPVLMEYSVTGEGFFLPGIPYDYWFDSRERSVSVGFASTTAGAKNGVLTVRYSNRYWGRNVATNADECTPNGDTFVDNYMCLHEGMFAFPLVATVGIPSIMVMDGSEASALDPSDHSLPFWRTAWEFFAGADSKAEGQFTIGPIPFETSESTAVTLINMGAAQADKITFDADSKCAAEMDHCRYLAASEQCDIEVVCTAPAGSGSKTYETGGEIKYYTGGAIATSAVSVELLANDHYCGDANIDKGDPYNEVCDMGNDAYAALHGNSWKNHVNGPCLPNCTPGGTCGNSNVEGSEQCDPPNGTTCSTICLTIPQS